MNELHIDDGKYTESSAAHLSISYTSILDNEMELCAGTLFLTVDERDLKGGEPGLASIYLDKPMCYKILDTLTEYINEMEGPPADNPKDWVCFKLLKKKVEELEREVQTLKTGRGA